VALSRVQIGDRAPEIVNAIVEIPKGSSNKYEYDEARDVIRLDRVLFSPVYYPAEYGFIPETRSPDGDHLDILVLISQPTFPGCVLEVAPVGILDMMDEAGRDWKIIGIATGDTRMASIQTIEQVNEHMRREIVHFFETYKDLEGKRVTVAGWRGRDEAQRVIADARARFAGEPAQRSGAVSQSDAERRE
jgi:inorganic pyrophosphatase